MSNLSEDDVALRGLAALAARSFGSTAAATQALLETIATQLGLRTAFLTKITPTTGCNHVLAAYNVPGGSGVRAGVELLCWPKRLSCGVTQLSRRRDGDYQAGMARTLSPFKESGTPGSGAAGIRCAGP